MQPSLRTLVLVCRGPECGDKRNSLEVHRELVLELGRAGTGKNVVLAWQSCFGQCRRGVNVLVREMRPGEDIFFISFQPGPDGTRSALYHGVLPSDARRIVGEHVVGGLIIEELKNRNP